MYVNVVRALTRREGLRLAAAGPRHLERKLATLALVAEFAPLRALLEPVNAEIARADEPVSDRGGHRTHDLRIKSPLLYQLSYPVRKPHGATSFARRQVHQIAPP